MNKEQWRDEEPTRLADLILPPLEDVVCFHIYFSLEHEMCFCYRQHVSDIREIKLPISCLLEQPLLMITFSHHIYPNIVTAISQRRFLSMTLRLP